MGGLLFANGPLHLVLIYTWALNRYVSICVRHEITLPYTFCFALPCRSRVLGYAGCIHTTYFYLEVKNKSENLTNNTKDCQCEDFDMGGKSFTSKFCSFFSSSLHNTSCLVCRWNHASSGLSFVLVMFFSSQVGWESLSRKWKSWVWLLPFVFLHVCDVLTQLWCICLEFSTITVL